MLKEFTSALRPALVMTALFALLLGLAYPAVLTALGQLAFPVQAGGSLVHRDGRVIGSDLIAQGFAAPRYFHPRPSAAGNGYDAANSSGSNFGPTSKPLADRVNRDVATLHKEAANGAALPPDLLTTSGSGLDPHISPEAARFQIARVAVARGITPKAVETLVASHVELPLLGFIGEPRVNVLDLNLALDKLAPQGAHTTR
ncbi:MAG: potassium-transporting ATPase subunit KdpC [Pseudomonadota bacterium]|nr:potassium-transporting ATPase subunit KdpC [Pseudomonadota bacterium]